MAARAGGGVPESQQLLDLQEALDSTSDADVIEDFLELLKSELAEIKRTKPNEKVSLPKLLNKPLLRKVRARPPTILVVGPAGVGKSSLINSLALRYVCKVQERYQAEHITNGLECNAVEIDIDGQSCELNIWDSQGFSGNTKEDDLLLKEIEEKIPNPDLVIVCYDITTNGGRINEQSHHTSLRLLNSVHGGQLLDQCVIALSKANVMALTRESEARSQKEHEHPGVPLTGHDWHDDFESEVKEWLEIWPKTLRESGVFQGQIDKIPVCIFGRVKFSNSAPCQPIKITPIGPWGERWLQDSWREILRVAKGDLSALLLMLINDFQSNPEIPIVLREAAPDPSQVIMHCDFKKSMAADVDSLSSVPSPSCMPQISAVSDLSGTYKKEIGIVGTVLVGAGLVAMESYLAPVTAVLWLFAAGGAFAARAADNRKKDEERKEADERKRIKFREAFYREYTVDEADAFIDGLQRARAKERETQERERQERERQERERQELQQQQQQQQQQQNMFW